MRSAVLALVYVLAIVAANLLITEYGPRAVLPVSFVFIGFNLSTRDVLHDLWGKNLVRNMLGLILAGGLASYFMNQGSGIIAIASVTAFLISETLDATVYHVLIERPYLQRSNGSNFVGALLDSLVFPTLAFGAFLPWVTLGQFAVKFFGGFVWSLLLNKIRRPEHGIS